MKPSFSEQLDRDFYKVIDKNRRYPAGTFGRIWSVAKLATILMIILTVGSVLYLATFEFSNALISIGLASWIFVALCERDRANQFQIEITGLKIDNQVFKSVLDEQRLRSQILTPQQIRDLLDNSD